MIMLDTLKKYNEPFMRDHSHGDSLSPYIFAFTDRGSKLILSAPHATRSFENHHEKIADVYTGALVQLLGEDNNISTIVRTKFVPYRTRVADYISDHKLEEHYFLDIHGFNQPIDYDICLGIGHFQEQDYPYLSAILSLADGYNLRCIVNHPNYKGLYGLTSSYQQRWHQPNVIQVELQPYLRDFYHHPDRVLTTTIPFFNDVIQLYES